MQTRTHTATLKDNSGNPLAVQSVTLYVVRDSDDQPVVGSQAEPAAAVQTGPSTGVWQVVSGEVYTAGQTYTENWRITYTGGNTYDFSLNFLVAFPAELSLDLCPVTLDQLRTHLRIDTDEDNDHLTALACAATEWVENHCNRFMLARPVVMRRTRFPHWRCDRDAAIALPRGPVSAIVSITYIDRDGDTITLDPSRYRLVPSVDTRPFASVQPVAGQYWPDDEDDRVLDGITITYTAGYGATPGAVPQPMVHAVKMLAAEWYRLREGVAGGQITGAQAPHGITNLLATQRFPAI